MAIINVNVGGNLQNALNSAQPGDTVRIDPAGTFTAGYEIPVTASNATQEIVVESMANASNFPNQYSRVNPSSHSAFMPKIRGPGSNTTPLNAGNYTHHWRFQFIEFQTTSNVSSIVAFGTSGSEQNTLDKVPRYMHMDRCIVRATSITPDVGRGVFLNSRYSDIKNCWIGSIKKVGQDAQAIMGINGPGDYLIENNYLEAAGENIMFGGGDPGIVGLNPQNIIIRRNYFYKPLVWKTQGSESWNVKNLFELKVGKYVTLEDNYLENCWHGEQQGVAIVLKSTNQDGGHTAAETAFVTVRRNVIRNMGGATNIAGNPERWRNGVEFPAVLAHDITFENNLFYDITWNEGWGRVIHVSKVNNAHFRHNTFVTVPDQSNGLAFFSETPVVDVFQGFIFNDNYGERGLYGIKGSDSGEGNVALADYTQNPQVQRNIVVGAPSWQYPSGNFYPATTGAVGFENYAGKDYRLASSSAYKGQGAGGKDVGVDHTLLNEAYAAVAGSYSGPSGSGGVAPGTPSSPSPAHAATGVSITPTLSWQAPGATSYNVKFGTSSTPPTVSTGQTGNSYTPATLANSTTYYWQIVAINADGTTTGPLWSFTTAAVAAALPVVAHVTEGGSAGSAVSSATWPHPSSGVNRCLFVTNAGSIGATSVTYNGIALTRFGNITEPTANGTITVQAWLLINPPVGTFNVVVTMSGSANFKCGAVTVTNVHQTTPFMGLVEAGSTTNKASAAVASALSHLVLSVVGFGPSTVAITSGAGQTPLFNGLAAGVSPVSAASTKPGT